MVKRNNGGMNMKKLLTTTLAVAVLISSTSAKAESWKDYLIDYGIPCALSLGAGMLLADKSQNGIAIGTAGCLGTGAVTYLNQRKDAKRINEEDMLRIQSMVEASSKKAVDEKEVLMDSRIKAMEEAQKLQLEELKGVLREVLAERMIKMEDEMKDFLTKKLESGELMPKLEANLSEILKKEVVSQVKAQQKSIVEKCVEETIKEVIAKPIGTQENPSGIE